MIYSIKKENNSVLSSLKSIQNNNKNVFIFAIGYEERSTAIFEKYIKDIDIPKLCFVFDDYLKYEVAINNKNIVEGNGLKPIPVGYGNDDIIIETIMGKIIELIADSDILNIHIDYSSMPRSWYCNIPSKINSLLRPVDKVFFWYSQGTYVKKAENWPSAGIEDFNVFSGKSSLRPINNRSHIMGLGFDSSRAQAIYSVLDPSFLVVTYSYPSNDEIMRDVLFKHNHSLINTAAFSIELPIDDFAFSISKLYETVKELNNDGDVILVPDGPKPQILATSLIPHIINKTGIICLHIKRHKSYYSPLNVKPKGGIFGFSYFVDRQ